MVLIRVTFMGILKQFLPLRDKNNSMNSADNSSCRRNLMKFVDVSLSTNHSILVMIRITLWMQEFLTDFFAIAGK